MKKTYIVSGGTGFVGNNAVRELSQSGADVRTLVRSKETHAQYGNAKALPRDEYRDEG